MLYTAYEIRRRMLAPVYETAGVQAAALRALPWPADHLPNVRLGRAVAETVGVLQLTHEHPGFGIDSIEVDGVELPVVEETVSETSFGRLQRFGTDGAEGQPKVMIVPGLAGHFGSLVRETVRTFVADHEVFVTDWFNARDVPVGAGRFGLEEYIEHMMGFLRDAGPGTHLIAVCQPCPSAIAAASLMAAEDDPCAPASLVLMSGPVDTRINPGRVNRSATGRPMRHLSRALCTTVPWPHRGAGRRVYPGFLQAMGFMSLAPRRHTEAFMSLMRDVAAGREAEATRTTAFYDEYFAVIDLTEEFYLETARAIFREHDLPRGRLMWHGRRVDPTAIRSPLMTIEGEGDEICPPGQTAAAHELCTGVPKRRRRQLVAEGVGHYGVFSGSRFRTEIYPEIRDFVAAADAAG